MKLNNLSLVAILGLGSCSALDSDETSLINRSTFIDRPYNSVTIPSNNSGYVSSGGLGTSGGSIGKDIDYGLKDVENSANVGPVEISPSQDDNSVRFKLHNIPASFELPITDRNYVSESNYFEEPNLAYDSWIVGNSYQGERQPVPLNVVGRALKDIIFDNVKPIRVLSEEVSRPVRFVFGDSAKLDFYQRYESLGVKLKFGSDFGDRWSWNYNVEIQASDNGEIGAMISFGVKTGIRNIVTRY